MNVVLGLLLLNGGLGAFDTLWYHEWKAQLAWHPERHRTELLLHAGRDTIYTIVYGSLGWVAWRGAMAAVLMLLLACEIVITMCDFVVEDRTRRLSAGERVLHAVMAIVYGAAMSQLLPIVMRWGGEPTGLTNTVDVAPVLAIGSILAGVGIALSGIRDLLAAFGDPLLAAPAGAIEKVHPSAALANR
jgi:hypothetical protein